MSQPRNVTFFLTGVTEEQIYNYKLLTIFDEVGKWMRIKTEAALWFWRFMASAMILATIGLITIELAEAPDCVDASYTPSA